MGNKSVVADPRRCVSCKSCMAACTAKHSVENDIARPRLRVVQVTRATTAPVLCHHCADAPCVAACPAGALFQDEANDRVGVDMSRCIGCRSCVAACPFGAVDVATCGQVVTAGGLALSAAADASVVKCDRCVDRAEGPACVQACGFSALRIVERDEQGAIIKIHDSGAFAMAGPSDLIR